MTLAQILFAAAASVAPEADTREFAQLTIQQRVVIRIPAMLAPPSRPQPRIRYKEKKGPKCLPLNGFAGAAIVAADSIDIFMRGGARLRAELDDECPAIDFYRGFYVLPTADGQVCAKRDEIRSRAGGQCGIERFRTLEPVK